MKLQNRPGTPQQNYFIFFPKKRMEGVWLWGEGVTGKKWWWQTERVQHKDVGGDTIERQLQEDTWGDKKVLWSTKTSAGGQQFTCFLLYINSFLFYFYLFYFLKNAFRDRPKKKCLNSVYLIPCVHVHHRTFAAFESDVGSLFFCVYRNCWVLLKVGFLDLSVCVSVCVGGDFTDRGRSGFT